MNFKNILRYIILGGIFILPFLPFYVADSMYFPFIAGKGFAFRIIVEAIFACWIILMLSDRSYAPKKSRILWAYIAFAVIVLLADIFGANPHRSFWSNYERMDGFITQIHLFAYFLIAGTVLSTEKLWDAFWKVSLGASIIMAVYGFLQLAGVAAIHQSTSRLDGTFGNAAYLAVYMLFSVFLALFYMARTWRKTRVEKWLYLAVAVIDFIILFYTATRGTILGLVGGILLSALLIAIFERRHRTIRKVSVGIIAAIIVLSGIFVLIKNVSFIKNNEVLGRFASISLHDKTTESRLIIWGMAWQGVVERPILGWGQDNFDLVFNKFYDPRMYDQEQWFDRAHNVVFDWLTNAGFLGAIAYFTLFGIIIWGIWRTKEFSTIGKSLLTGLLAGYFVHNFFVFDNIISYIGYFSIAAWVYNFNIAPKRTSNAPLMNMEVVNYGLAPVAAILFIIALYFINVRPIQANTTLISALEAESDPTQSLAYYKQAIGYDTFGTPETRERLVLDAPTIVQNASSTEQSAFLSYAEDQMQQQVQETPHDARYELFLGAFLDQVGQYDQALQYLSMARADSPKKQAIIIQQGLTYLSENEATTSLQYFKEAYDLEPAYSEARVSYALGAAYAGDESLAKSLLSGLDQQTLTTDDRVISAYAKIGDYQDILPIWQARVAADPTNIQDKISLAATYLELGQNTDAISTLKQISAEDPQYATQVDEYISQIQAGKNPVQQ